MKREILLIAYSLYAIGFSLLLARKGHRSRALTGEGSRRARPTRVLIVGATGGTGRQLVEQALERGFEVTALARNPAALQVAHPKLRILQGDVLDRASVDTAMRGQEAVLCALGHKRFFGPTRILSDGTRNILDAMEAQQVPRLICETSTGLGNAAWSMGLLSTLLVLPVILPFYFYDKTRQERLIAESGVDWVIVRPGRLTTGAKRGRARHGPQVTWRPWAQPISRADVASFMLEQLESDTYLRAAVSVVS
jgi:putative NADH-flavin reductase